MINALRLARGQPHPLLPSLFPSTFGQKISGVRFRQAKSKSTQPENQDSMDKTQNQKIGDVMSHSFGEGYSTRSDEEGFGGTCRGNQSLPNPDKDKVIHENHPDYDKTQGSHVQQKERARNQPNNACT